MARYGGFETTGPEVHSGVAGGGVLVARRAGVAEAKFAVKLYQPHSYLIEESELQANTVLFLEAADAQREVSEKGGAAWAPVHESGLTEGGAWYATDLFERSIEKLVVFRRELEGKELQRVVEQVVQGLLELKRASGRPHGNLKATNVLVSGRGEVSQARIALCDPLAASKLRPAEDADRDMRELGDLIHQLVLHRPMRQLASWPLQMSEEWSRLGKLGPQWLELTNKLLNPTPGARRPSIEEVNEMLPAGPVKLGPAMPRKAAPTREDAERLAQEQQKREELERQAAAERRKAEEAARLEAERRRQEEQQRAEAAAREKSQREKLEREKAEREAKERAEAAAAREEVAREQAERERAAKEKAERELKEKADAAARERAAREQAERAAKDAAEKERREKAAKAEQAAKEKAAKDRAEREAKEREAREAKEREARESKERDARERAERERREREAAASAVAPGAAPAEARPAPIERPAPVERPEGAAGTKKKFPIAIVAVAAVVVIGGGIAAVVMSGGKGDSSKQVAKGGGGESSSNQGSQPQPQPVPEPPIKPPQPTDTGSSAASNGDSGSKSGSTQPADTGQGNAKDIASKGGDEKVTTITSTDAKGDAGGTPKPQATEPTQGAGTPSRPDEKPTPPTPSVDKQKQIEAEDRLEKLRKVIDKALAEGASFDAKLEGGDTLAAVFKKFTTDADFESVAKNFKELGTTRTAIENFEAAATLPTAQVPGRIAKGRSASELMALWDRLTKKEDAGSDWPPTSEKMGQIARLMPTLNEALEGAAATHREELKGRARQQAVDAWSAALSAKNLTDADIGALRDLAGPLGTKIEQIPSPTARLNVLIWDVKQQNEAWKKALVPGQAPAAGLDDQIRAKAAEFAKAAEQIDKNKAGGLIQMLNGIAAPPVTPAVDLSKVGPGAAGWSASGGPDVVTYTLGAGGGTASVEFRKVEYQTAAGTRVAYLSTGEVSINVVSVLGGSGKVAAWKEVSAEMADFASKGWGAESGPLAWLVSARTGKLSARTAPADSKGWLASIPGVAQRYPAGMSVDAPAVETPMQQIQAVEALLIAHAAGCRLPSVDEWRAAAGRAGRVESDENLRDQTWQAMRAFAEANNGRTPDRGAFNPQNKPEGTAATALPKNDGILWFRAGNAGQGEFKNVVGNVAELVCNDSSKLDAASVDSVAAAASALAGAGLAVIGGSALSAPEYNVQDALPLADPQTRWADVGFRLAFSAEAGPPPLAPVAVNQLAGITYLSGE